MRSMYRNVVKVTGVILVAIFLSAFMSSPPPVLSQVIPKRIYIAPDEHTDYFWTADAETYQQVFLEMFDYYLDLADATANEPVEFQSRWNADGSLWMWTYERNRSASEFERLIERIRDGHVSVPLNALAVCLGGAPAEAVLRGMYYPGQIERRYDLRFPLVYSMENQTLPYGLGSLWAGSGAKYSWKGICGCASKVSAPGDREHEIYWMVGPDGSRVLMKWNSMLNGSESMGGYAEARHPGNVVDYVDTDPAFSALYPYDIIGAFGKGWDDLKTLTDEFITVAKSKTNANRTVIVSNEQDFFEDFEATYGSTLPSQSSSFGNEWDLYCASMAEVSARVKRAVEKLRGAEALTTLVSLQDADFMSGRESARDQAWMDLGLYWEHDWTADGPVPRSTRANWQRQLAGEIEDYVNALQADAATELGGMINKSGTHVRFYVFNPLSWTRTDMADLPYSDTDPVHVIDLSSGEETPSQIVMVDGERYLRILARNVPSVGYKVFEVHPGAGETFSDAAVVSGEVMENDFYRITVADRGAITSLVDKMRGNREFAREINGRIINDLGSGSGTLAIENAGPVSVTLKATSSSPLSHTTRITLTRYSRRIDIRNDINQNFNTTHTWGFGFDLDKPDVWHEEVGAVIRAKLSTQGGDYSPRNARYDWLTLNHFADINSGSSAEGVTISNADCYFMKLGASTPSVLDVDTPQISALVGGQVDGTGLGIRNQGNDTHFLQRFALQTHDDYDQVAAMRFALEHQNQLITGVITGGDLYPETSYSLLTVSDPKVLLWALKPADDGIEKGIVTRLWNLSPTLISISITSPAGEILSAKSITHIETPLEDATVIGGELVDELAGQQLKTFSLNAEIETNLPDNSPPIADAGVDQVVVDFGGDNSEAVTLDGSGSSDSDGTIVSYKWYEGGSEIASGEFAQALFSVGTHTVTLEVTDDDGVAASDTVMITVNGPVNSPPVADAGVDQVVVDFGGDNSEAVTLDGSGSSDSDGTIVSYKWYEGGSEIASGEFAQALFSVGTHTVTLEVTNDDGATASDTVMITVNGLANQPPLASFTADPTSGELPLMVSFDATASYDPDGTVVSYEWDFGDGSTDSGDMVSPSHIYTSAGSYTVTLAVTDDMGMSAIASNTITVTIGEQGTGLEGVYFDNMDLSNPKLTRIDPSIDFDWGYGSPDPAIGPDTFSVRWTGQIEPLYTETYTFYAVTDDGFRLWIEDQLVIDSWRDQAPTERSGTIALTAGVKYDIKIEYYENLIGAVARLLWSSPQQPKEVVPVDRFFHGGGAVNSLPVADAGVDQVVVDFGGDNSEAVTLDGSGSSDSDGTIVSYKWYEGGSEIASGEFAQALFSVGTHTVTLEVTDDDGVAASDTVMITVNGPVNSPPVADAGVDQVVVDFGGDNSEAVTLDGSGSSDSDGTIVSYKWYEGGSEIASGEFAQALFSVGTHTVTLEVTDDDGVAASDTVMITVNGKVTLEEGLLAYWPFDEEADNTARDYSGLGNDGIVFGALWTPEGKIGGALSFDGVNDSVRIPDSPSLASAHNQITVAFWIYPTNLSTAWSTVMHRTSATDSWFDWQVYARAVDAKTTNNPVFRVDWDFDSVMDTDEEVEGDVVLRTNRWYFIACTYDGSQMKFYIDATLRGSTTKASGTIPNSGSDIWIGGNGVWGEYFSGLIDEIRIYDHALSEEEIQILANAVDAAVNNAPVAVDSSYVTAEDAAFSGNLSATDADGDGLVFSIVSAAAKGMVTINDAALGLFTYVPDENVNGTDSFTFKVNDGETDSNTATVFVTINPVNDPPVIVSDDFHSSVLNEQLWSFIDPMGDVTFSMTGTQAKMSLPADSNHGLWTYVDTAPRLLQPAKDVDFEVEVKFDSPVENLSQSQGVLVLGDSNTFLKFAFHGVGYFTEILATSFTDHEATMTVFAAMDNGVPLYMRIKREGDLWTQSYSYDGDSWTIAGSFNSSLLVNRVGVFAENTVGPATPSPGYTVLIDYFFNTTSPVDPEDDGTE